MWLRAITSCAYEKMERLKWVDDEPSGKEVELMARRTKAINSLLIAHHMRRKLISVAAAVALFLFVIFALSGAASAEEIRFTGTVTGTSPPEQVGALWWNVSVEAISSGPQTSCETLTVELIVSPPVGDYDPAIAIGDRVVVYGNYTGDCTVSLNNESYYMLFYAIPIPSEIRFTGTVTGMSPPEQVGVLWWNVSVETISSGPHTSCDTLTVEVILSPPVGDYDSAIGIGDRVEVYGNYTADCTVSLNGLNYSITRPKYPSIPGIHNGTITPLSNITVSRLYTLPCPGTGGHTEYVRFWNSTDWNVTATWFGYTDDWQTIFFNRSFTLYANETYNYTIQTGSYPQLHYTAELLTATERITCTSFVDVNGNRHEGWIPAIRLMS